MRMMRRCSGVMEKLLQNIVLLSIKMIVTNMYNSLQFEMSEHLQSSGASF